MKNTVGMRCFHIEKWIVSRRISSQAAVAIVPQAYVWILSGSVVIYHIQDHRHPSAVAFIDQFFKCLRRSIIFVQCAVKRGVITPTFIPVKFADWYEFDG